VGHPAQGFKVSRFQGFKVKGKVKGEIAERWRVLLPTLAAQEQRVEGGAPAYCGWTKFAAVHIGDNQVWTGPISFGTLAIFYSYEESGAIRDYAKNDLARRIPCVLSRIDAGN
jgi:hypothetical protein